MPANDTLLRLNMAAGSAATAPTSAGAAYGLWAAFFYDGGTTDLALFTITACVGMACAASGLYRRLCLITDFGLLLTALAPVGFAWVSSVVSLPAGAVLLFRKILKRRRRKRRGPKLESDEPSVALENDEVNAKPKPSSLALPTLNG